MFAVGAQKTHRVLKGHEIAAIHPFLIDLKNHNVTLPLKGNVTDRHVVNQLPEGFHIVQELRAPLQNDPTCSWLTHN